MITLLIVALTYVLTSGSFGVKMIAIASNMEIFAWIILGIVSVILMVVAVVFFFIGKDVSKSFPIWMTALFTGVFSLVIAVKLGIIIALLIIFKKLQEIINPAATDWASLGSEAHNLIFIWIGIFVVSLLIRKNKKNED